MSYYVKEIFYSLQGEGARAGRPAVFCRFSGCNLWSGKESDRLSSKCAFCDTDFLGTDGPSGGKFATEEELCRQITSKWPGGKGNRYVVLTGGEPLLQVTEKLIEHLHDIDFEVAVETNGTIVAPRGIDWLVVSPKVRERWVQRTGDELKLAFPQPHLSPHEAGIEKFSTYFLQPIDGPDLVANTESALNFCLKNPVWRLSIQTHKIVGIP